MRELMLTARAVERVLQHEKLLKEEDFMHGKAVQSLEEGEVVSLVDVEGTFVAKALMTFQQKGVAWVFTLVKYDPWNQEMVEEWLQEAIDKREAYFNNQDTTAFRLYNGEGDGVGGVTMDWYDHYVQINWYSKGVYQYRQWFVDVLVRLLPNIQGIYETKRYTLEEGEEAISHTYGQMAPSPLVILEDGVRYAIHLGEEWMTGLFLDQREVRQFVRMQSQQLKVLNLFSYTGAFSVAAAMGCASATISVDVANRSLSKTQENFMLNRIDSPSEFHDIRIMDVFDYIHYAQRHALTYDMVVCDPPSFARTKDYQFRAEKDYVKLAQSLFELVAAGGMCIVSTNHSGYYRRKFQADMTKVATQNGAYLIQSFGVPMDFATSQDEESHYLKVLVFYKGGE